ncbi:MAG: pyruvate kinase [Clostridiales bacterium]|nr:pyruvate kinase [Clostridiales bacterium]
MRKTKVICTLGPASDMHVKELIQEGMNVARFNFSHGTYEEHEKRLNQLKEEIKKQNACVATLLDTKGPEIRVKQFENPPVNLEVDNEFTLTTRDIIGNEHEVAVTYKNFPKEVTKGTRVLLDDGLIELEVIEVVENDVRCVVKNGGVLSNNKGVNLPNVELSMPYMSEKDKRDIIWGIEHDYDYVAASFVRTADDVKTIRDHLNANGGQNIKIIAKIENNQGVEHIDEILEASDGVMIARGDMGVEIPVEEVPVIQKMMIKKACAAGKLVITATQMLDSMIKNPRPTRAEATDVANAIYDGTGAIMLSGETAAGKYPVEALKMMVRIAERTEQDIDYRKRFLVSFQNERRDITDAISHATCMTSYDLEAQAIITVTKSGRAARMVSRYRPNCNILGCSTNTKVCRQLSLVWGVQPLLLEEKEDVLELFDHAVETAKQVGILKEGDVAVITSGVPLGISGTTNMIKVCAV